MEGRLVAARPGDDGLAGLVAAELQAFEPGRPAAVQDALNADLVAHRRLGGHGAACGPAHLVSETTVATKCFLEVHAAWLSSSLGTGCWSGANGLPICESTFFF